MTEHYLYMHTRDHNIGNYICILSMHALVTQQGILALPIT